MSRDDQREMVRMTIRLGDLALRRGDIDGAQKLFEEGLPILRRLKFSPAVAEVLAHLTEVARLKGQFAQAIDLAREGLRLCIQIDHGHGVQSALELLAVLAATSGQSRTATQLVGAAQVSRTNLGILPEDTFWNSVYEQHVLLARTALGQAEFAAQWASGGHWTLERAIQEGLSFGLQPQGSGAVTATDLFSATNHQTGVGLSPRELDVLECMARGLSNKAVARALQISDHTVKFHLNVVLNKLGCRTRAEAVRSAFDQGLMSHPDDAPGGSS